MLLLLLGDVGCVYHVHRPHLWGNLFYPPVFSGRGSSSSSLCSPLSLFSAFNLPACLNTQQSLLVWLAGLSGVPCIWHERSSIRSKLDGPGVLLLNGFFR